MLSMRRILASKNHNISRVDLYIYESQVEDNAGMPLPHLLPLPHFLRSPPLSSPPCATPSHSLVALIPATAERSETLHQLRSPPTTTTAAASSTCFTFLMPMSAPALRLIPLPSLYGTLN